LTTLAKNLIFTALAGTPQSMAVLSLWGPEAFNCISPQYSNNEDGGNVGMGVGNGVAVLVGVAVFVGKGVNVTNVVAVGVAVGKGVKVGSDVN
jgi:hypothetical protein